ncbi:MAG: RluA family pseudouridine synthase [Lutispora sp.]|nr:RluA family pseudouridine synthase [Lutispora sp.]
MKEITITENETGQRLDRFTRKLLKEAALSEIYKGIRKGDIKVNGKKSKEGYMLAIGDIVSLKNISIEPESAPKKKIDKSGDINIVYEDENIIIIDKPAGLLSHPQSVKDKDTLIHRVQHHIELSTGSNTSPTFSPALCNRLDRNTAGLVIAAKNYKSLKAINEMIRERHLKKLYLCIVKGSTDINGEISSFLEKDETNRKAFLSDDADDRGKESKTYYEKKSDNGEYSLLFVELVTGRFHQIRAHLASIDHPIIGDVKYGDKKVNEYFRNKFELNHQLLIAHIISFENPPTELQYLKNKIWHSSIPKAYRGIVKFLFGQ